MMLGHMMFEGKHIHYSPVDNKPLCSYSAKLCKQRRLNGYAFCIRHILEDKSAPFKQCAFVAKYNRQKCTNPIPANEDREYCNSHMQVLGMAPKKERKGKKEKESPTNDGKLRFADRLRALLKTDASQINATEDTGLQDDPYAFPDSETENVQSANTGNTETVKKLFPELTAKLESARTNSEVTKTTTIVITSSNLSTVAAAAAKATSLKTSKTMNRLQAKIAQNKILDKLRKTQESSQPAVVIPVTTSSPLASPSEQSLEQTQTELLAASPQQLLEFPSVPTLSFPTPFTTDFPQYSYPQPPSSSSQYAGLSTLSTTTATTTTTTTLTLLPSVSRPQLSPVTIAPYITHNIPVIHIQPKQHKLNKKLELLSRIKNIPPSVHKFLTMQQERRLEHSDLFPLGLELSDSEGSENFEDDDTPWQQHWLPPSSGEDSDDDDDDDDESNLGHPWLTSSRARELQLSQVRTQLKGQLLQLTRTNRTHKLLQRSRSKLIQCIMQAARTHSSLCVEALVNFSCRRSSKETTKPKGDFLGLEQKQCCYTNDKESCPSSALPYTRHCIKHIMYNVDQLLFEHCTAKFADNTQCCVPVFDICHELPLCPEHARKRDNYNKLAAEPKPKKPRKKTKPSALTRPPKRGKKKKRATYVRPQKPRSPLEFKAVTTTTTTAISTTLPGVEKEEISLNLGIDTSQLSPATNNISADDLTKDFDGNLDNDLDHELDSDLEDDLLPGHIDKSLELPLDAADLANPTRLLEDHELNEVLNKLPDDAFQDLFTGKNGEFIPSKEETEELERALAAVSKDVKSVKESLEKLSALSEDDLSNSMDIHNNILNSDHTGLPDLSHASVDLNAIAHSMVASDLSSISQALSTNTDSLTLSQVQGQLSPGLLTSHILQVQVPGTATYSLAPHILAADALISPQRVFTDEQAVSHALSTIMAQVPNSFTTVAITDAIASHSVNQDGLPPGLDSPLPDIRNPWTSVVADQSLGTTTYSNGYPICLPPYTQQTLNKFTFPTLAVTLPANTTISNIVTNTNSIPRTVVPTFTVTTTTSQADS